MEFFVHFRGKDLYTLAEPVDGNDKGFILDRVPTNHPLYPKLKAAAPGFVQIDFKENKVFEGETKVRRVEGG